MFVPNYMFDTVYDIPFELFEENGIKCLFLDIDNTLVPYEIALPTKENIEWFEKLQCMGIKLFFVSNNHADRVDKYAEGLGIPYEYEEYLKHAEIQVLDSEEDIQDEEYN